MPPAPRPVASKREVLLGLPNGASADSIDVRLRHAERDEFRFDDLREMAELEFIDKVIGHPTDWVARAGAGGSVAIGPCDKT